MIKKKKKKRAVENKIWTLTTELPAPSILKLYGM